MPRRSSCTGTAPRSRPSSSIVPLVGSISRLIMRSVVVLPQPEEPSSTVISRLGISSVRPSTATVPSGYRLETSLNVIMSGAGRWQGQALRSRPTLSTYENACLRVANLRDVHAGLLDPPGDDLRPLAAVGAAEALGARAVVVGHAAVLDL